MQGQIIRGRVTTGIGHGKAFTRLDWARRQFVQRLAIDPFPGTLNVHVETAADSAVWTALKATPGIRIDNPGNGPHDCDARCYPILVERRFEAAIVLPEVDGYAPAQIEFIAAVGLRDALAIVDGDTLELTIR